MSHGEEVSQLMNTMPSRYDAVLLDIDGTLVDSNGAHAAAWSDAFAAYGRHHPPEQIRPLIGKGGDKLLRELASLDDESGEGKKIAEARVEIFRTRYLPTLKPTSGAAAFVEWLLESGLTVVVATSAKDDEVKALLTICGGWSVVVPWKIRSWSFAKTYADSSCPRACETGSSRSLPGRHHRECS